MKAQERVEAQMRRDLQRLEMDAKMKKHEKNRVEELKATIYTKEREKHNERQREIYKLNQRKIREAQNLGARLTKIAS